MCPNLIVMLTHNDCTVDNAAEIFELYKKSKAQFWGFKEKNLPFKQMKVLFSYMKSLGKTTVLEVVDYDEIGGLNGAKIAFKCGCDILMRTNYYDSINDYCKNHHIKYMPFIGKVTKRPSILSGSIDEIIDEAKLYLSKGVYGLDLLGYRYDGDANLLMKRLLEAVQAPICIAGSIDNYKKLNFLKNVHPWAFTIGSAFFDNKFNGNFDEQIDKVCDFMEK